MTTWQTLVAEITAGLGLALTPLELARMESYMALLRARATEVNLTAITDPEAMAVKHFADSLTVELVWTPQPGERLIDIGTGAGFPGLPLAIRHPEVSVTLVDSVRKKVNFVDEAIGVLGLMNASARWGRAEEMGRGMDRERYEVATARAVAHLGALVEYVLPLLKVGGLFIALKGPDGALEIPESARALEAIGGTVERTHACTLPDAGERLLIVVRKTRTTPGLYPRDPGAAKQKPLYARADRP
jgi:16S rRNA (guanine527-N7)-methyltransferase